MSVWATTWAWEQPIKPPGKKFTLLALADFADENGHCYPSQETLAVMTSQGVRTVREHLQELENETVIRRERGASAQGFRSSDDIWLQAPADRLRPRQFLPAKSAGSQNDLPAKSAGSQNDLPAKSARTYRQISPPAKFAGKPLIESDDPSEEEPSHTLRARAHEDAPPGERSVCVKSRFSFEDRVTYAERHRLGAGWLQLSGDGRYDDTIDIVKQQTPSPTVAGESKREVLSFDDAVEIIEGMVHHQGRDPREVIADIPVDGDVRDRLLEKFAA